MTDGREGDEAHGFSHPRATLRITPRLRADKVLRVHTVFQSALSSRSSLDDARAAKRRRRTVSRGRSADGASGRRESDGDAAVRVDAPAALTSTSGADARSGDGVGEDEGSELDDGDELNDAIRRYFAEQRAAHEVEVADGVDGGSGSGGEGGGPLLSLPGFPALTPVGVDYLRGELATLAEVVLQRRRAEGMLQLRKALASVVTAAPMVDLCELRLHASEAEHRTAVLSMLERRVGCVVRDVEAGKVALAEAYAVDSLCAALRMVLEPPVTGHTLARIMHGVPSPCFPWSGWSSTRWWGKFREHRFDALQRIGDAVVACASEEVLL